MSHHKRGIEHVEVSEVIINETIQAEPEIQSEAMISLINASREVAF